MSNASAEGDSKRWSVIFVLGAPGAGKGTQCSLLSKRMELSHLSAGDLIRRERDTVGSKYGRQIVEAIREPGTFVPAAITCELLRRAMTDCGKDKFIIDGFPINWSNLQTWNRSLEGETKVPYVLFLDIPENVSVTRCLSRGRKDDTTLVLKKRFESYVTETKPVVEYYRTNGMLRTVDGTLGPNEVFRCIVEMSELNNAEQNSGS